MDSGANASFNVKAANLGVPGGAVGAGVVGSNTSGLSATIVGMGVGATVAVEATVGGGVAVAVEPHAANTSKKSAVAKTINKVGRFSNLIYRISDASRYSQRSLFVDYLWKAIFL